MNESNQKIMAQWKNNPRIKSGGGIPFLVIFALIWNGLCSPVYFMGGEIIQKEGLGTALVIALFPLVGLFMILGVIYTLLRRFKFGVTILEMESFPGVIGGYVKAQIELPLKLQLVDSIPVTLACIKQSTSGSGKNRSTSYRMLWQQELRIKPSDLRVHQGKLMAPLEFLIPHDCKETTQIGNHDGVFWKIDLKADLPGIDFYADFKLPVMLTPASDPAITCAKAEAFALSGLGQEVELPAILDLRHSPGHGLFIGTPFFRFSKQGVICSIIFFICCALEGYFIYASISVAPWICGFFVFLFFWIAMSGFWQRSEMILKGGKGRVKNTLLGLGCQYTFELADLQEAQIRTGTQSSSGDKVTNWYGFKLCGEGKDNKIDFMEFTTSKNEALAVVKIVNDFLAEIKET